MLNRKSVFMPKVCTFVAFGEYRHPHTKTPCIAASEKSFRGREREREREAWTKNPNPILTFKMDKRNCSRPSRIEEKIRGNKEERIIDSRQ